MISRRIFFSICVMMMSILMLFQFSITGRDLANNYNENIHMPETNLSRSDAFSERSADDTAQTVLYIGSEDGAAGRIVRQWCGYTKRKFVQYNSMEDYAPTDEEAPMLLCLTGDAVTTAEQVYELSAMVQEGQNVLFCDVPETAVLRRLPELQTLLGIRKVERAEVELTGIHLFSGFLLGKEAIYMMEDEEEKLDQEVHLSAPWYLRLSGTKCYMAGMLEDEEIDNEDLPPLIWKNSHGHGRVFVVNGPYMQDETGLGILSGILYELQDYVLYPVVNAQNLSVANFPIIASENPEELMEIYARELSHLQSEVMWPNMILATSKRSYKMTNFLTPRLDYSVRYALRTNDLTFYLKQFREQYAETGLSLDHLPGISLRNKLTEDQAFFDSSASTYPYSAAYVGSNEKEAFLAVRQQRILKNLRTITGTWDNADILSYCTETISAQKVTADGFVHPYQQDLRVRAVETALGYSNILLDMKCVAWPEEDEPHWEVLSEMFSKNINTYWRPFAAFDKTTLTESDGRVRAFFSLDYTDTRRDDIVTVEIKNDGDHWFLLRTHAEDISSMTGGDYIELEEDVYLIHAPEKSMKIKLEERQNKRYYLP